MRFIRLTHRIGLCSPTMAVPQGKCKESSSCSDHEAGCFWSPSLILEPGKIPQLLPLFSLHWNLAGCNRVNELASESEGKQAKRKICHPCTFLWAALECVVQAKVHHK